MGTPVIWIDTDMGFDDILAIQMVAQSGLEIAGISLVFGNGVLPQICDNAFRAAAFFDWDSPFFKGAEAAINGSVITAEHVLGPTGIPTLGRPFPPASSQPLGSAVPALCAWLEASSEPRDILALGPLTNIATLITTRPDLVPKIRRLVWMGGGATTGNHTPAAEFNAFADPEAVAVIFESRIALRMIDLDVCRQVSVAPEEIVPLLAHGSDRALLLHELYGGFLNIAISRKRPAMALYDVVAAAAVIDPLLVSFVPVEVEVELSNTPDRGRTIVNRGPNANSNIQIGDKADAARIKELALELLLHAAA